jgi:hypothetical protein
MATLSQLDSAWGIGVPIPSSTHIESKQHTLAFVVQIQAT